jgi:hypothetical protein
MSISLWILSGALIFHLRGDESFVGAGAVQYLLKVLGLGETLMILPAFDLGAGLLGNHLHMLNFLYEEFLEEILFLDGTLLLN